MNGLRCPKCGLVNLLSADTCHRCGTRFENIDRSLEVSVPVEETFRARGISNASERGIPQDSEIGRKTFLWYRVYCAAMLLLYLAATVFGVFMLFYSAEAGAAEKQQDALVAGIVYLVIGPVFSLIFAIGLFLPRKPYNWIYGIAMIAIGLTSCCLIPATVPLLIFWLKPETKAYLGRT